MNRSGVETHQAGKQAGVQQQQLISHVFRRVRLSGKTVTQAFSKIIQLRN